MAGDRAWVLDGAVDALWVVNDANIMSDTVTTVAGLCRARAEMVGARDKAWARRRGRVDPLNYISLIEHHTLVHNPASRLVSCLHLSVFTLIHPSPPFVAAQRLDSVADPECGPKPSVRAMQLDPHALQV